MDNCPTRLINTELLPSPKGGSSWATLALQYLSSWDLSERHPGKAFSSGVRAPAAWALADHS